MPTLLGRNRKLGQALSRTKITNTTNGGDSGMEQDPPRALTLLLTLTRKVRQQRTRTRSASPRATFLATCTDTNKNQKQAGKLNSKPRSRGGTHPRLTSRQNVRTSERWGVMMGNSVSSISSRASRASQAFTCGQGSHRILSPLGVQSRCASIFLPKGDLSHLSLPHLRGLESSVP